MFRLTQHQINHGIFGLITLAALGALIQVLITPAFANDLLPTIIAVLSCGALWVAYWRGWRYAKLALIIATTMIASITTPQVMITSGFSQVVFIAPALALVLTSPAWVLASGGVMLISFAVRVGGGPYLDPSELLIFVIVLGSIVLSRLAVDNVQRLEAAKREAEAERARAESERNRVAAQASELAERNAEQQRLFELVATLETPTITVAEGVLLAPIVGALDSRRAQALTSRLLQASSAQRARQVILDIAGVTLVDTQVAQALLQSAQALRLLGCAVTITGISATVATTLTHLGIALDNVATARSPQEVLASSARAPLNPLR